MKTFSNANARDVRQAIALSADARQQGRAASFAGGGSDLLALVKERVISPDVIVSLKPIRGFDRVAAEGLKVCSEIIQQVKEIPGVSGIHVMAFSWEDAIPEILERAGLSRRQVAAGGN